MTGRPKVEFGGPGQDLDPGSGGRLQNNHKRGLAIVAEEVLDLKEVLGRRQAKSAAAPGAGTAAIPKKVG